MTSLIIAVNRASRATVAAAANLTQTTTQFGTGTGTTLGLSNTNVYALTSDNSIYIMPPGTTRFFRLAKVTDLNGGNLIGIDFRPADKTPTTVYGLTDTGSIYKINLSPFTGYLGATTLVSTLSPRFVGGFQSLMDFNPVVNALRIIGDNDDNFAVVNANGGNLNQTTPQTRLAYVAGDPNAGVDPNITAGAYNNNYAGATTTIFYMLDHDLDTLVTIANTTNGSSATGGGQLKTIGQLFTTNTNTPLNIAPTAGIDIFTDPNGVEILMGISGTTVFALNTSQINKSLPVGQTQNLGVASFVAATGDGDIPPTGGFIDIAVPPYAGPSPTPTPTPTPTSSATPAPTPSSSPSGTKCVVSYVVTSQFSGGFVTNVTIQNNTGINLNGWNLAFSFSGNQNVTSFWNSTLTQSAQNVKFGSVNYNANFPNNTSVNLGFQATFSGTNATPTNFALNGIPCVRR